MRILAFIVCGIALHIAVSAAHAQDAGTGAMAVRLKLDLQDCGSAEPAGCTARSGRVRFSGLAEDRQRLVKRNLSRALTALRLTAADGATGGSGTSDCKSTWGASYFKVTCELCSGVQCCKCTINSWDFPNPPPCSCYEG